MSLLDEETGKLFMSAKTFFSFLKRYSFKQEGIKFFISDDKKSLVGKFENIYFHIIYNADEYDDAFYKAELWITDGRATNFPEIVKAISKILGFNGPHNISDRINDSLLTDAFYAPYGYRFVEWMEYYRKHPKLSPLAKK